MVMLRRTGIGTSVVTALLGLAVTSCDWATPKVPGAEQRTARQKLADARRLKQACGSAQTYDRLKALTFDEAGKARSNAPGVLDAVAANAIVRMENPVARSRDEQLDITMCEGHLVLDLPAGIQGAPDGGHRLEADVRYSAQQAADGSGLVYRMQGAEPIISRLAALAPHGERDAQVTASAGPPPAAVAGEAPVREAPVSRAPVVAGPASAAPAMVPPPPRSYPAPVRAPQAPLPRPVRPTVAVAAAPPETEAATRPPSTAARPSFSCGAVQSHVLRMVCADPALAAQDRRMSATFYAGLANGDDRTRAALRASRDRFLAFRNRCATPACVSQAYDDRIAEIRDIAGE